MFGLDDALADVVARATQPALGAIKLAWWNERLSEMDEGMAPAEPRLRAVAAELLPRGVTGTALAGLTDGWATLFEEVPDIERAGEGGARLFAVGAGLLGASDPLTETAGRLYRQERIARRQLAPVHWPMDELGQLAGHRFPRALRPLTALAALAARDARWDGDEAEATPGRSWALIRHWITGRI